MGTNALNVKVTQRNSKAGSPGQWERRGSPLERCEKNTNYKDTYRTGHGARHVWQALAGQGNAGGYSRIGRGRCQGRLVNALPILHQWNTEGVTQWMFLKQQHSP